MSFDENPADDRYQLDLCLEEIKRLNAERDEAIKAAQKANGQLDAVLDVAELRGDESPHGYIVRLKAERDALRAELDGLQAALAEMEGQ